MNTVNSLLGRGSLEQYLLARHRAIDLLLERAIEDHGIRQVIEIASGLSARGWRFSTRYDDVTYIEADLPEMVARKQEALDRIDGRSPRHRVVELDALEEAGPGQPGLAWPASWTRARDWRSSPRACWAISRPIRSWRIWARIAAHPVRLRARALHLRHPPVLAPDD